MALVFHRAQLAMPVACILVLGCVLPLAVLLVFSVFEGGLKHGLFHGDLHAGNLHVDKDGKIVFFDFGIMGRIDPRTRWLLRELVYALLVSKDHAAAGRIVVMSYQSLEDRMVKRTLVAGAASTAPRDLPVVPPEHQPLRRLLTRGAETASAEEVAANPRAASVRLRAAERLRDAA